MKKFIWYLTIITLFAGSIAGIYFGIKFKISQDELAKYSESIQVIEDLKNQLKSANEREETLTVNLALITAERDQNQQQVNSLTIEIETKNTRITELESKAEEDKISITDLTAEKTRLEGELATSEEANSTKQSRIQELEAEITRLENQGTADSETISNLQAEKESLETELSTAQEECATKQTKIEELNGRISELETSLSNTQSAKAEVEAERNQLQSDKTALESQIAQANETIATLQSEKLALQNEVTRLTAELEVYQGMELTGVNKCEFVYMDGENEIVDSVVYVEEGSNLSYIPVVENTAERWFYGWATTQGTTEAMDLTNIVPTEDMTFYAVTSNCVSVGINGSMYRVGERLKVKDLIKFDSRIDMTNEKVTFDITKGTATEQPTLDSLVTDLPFGRIGGAYYVNKEYKVVKGYQLNYLMTYHYSSANTINGCSISGKGKEIFDNLDVEYVIPSDFKCTYGFTLNGSVVEQQVTLPSKVDKIESYQKNMYLMTYSFTISGTKVDMYFYINGDTIDWSVGPTADSAYNAYVKDVSFTTKVNNLYTSVIDEVVDLVKEDYWENQ